MYRFDQLDSKIVGLEVEVAELRKEILSIRLKIAALGGISGLLGWAVPQILTWMATNNGG